MISLLSDMEMIIHKFPDRPDILIYPICDVHLGAAEHMELEWGGYAAQKMHAPTSHAPQIITLRGTKKEMRVEM